MHRPQLSSVFLPLLLAPLQGSALECSKIVVDGHKFDLTKLGGPHSVVTTQYNAIAESHMNTTYTLDVCNTLKKSGDAPKNEQCPMGTRVCAIKRLIKKDVDIVEDVLAIAGSLENAGGSAFDYEATRLKTSDSNSDSQKEGLRLVLKGGKHPLKGPNKDKHPQKAVIEFVCDKDKTGLEDEWKPEDRYDGDDRKLRRRGEDDKVKEGEGKDDDSDDGTESGVEHQLKKEGAALIWESYGKDDKGADVLRLTWHTKEACEKRDEGDDEPGSGGSSSGHWGFFTWFIIILFLGIASYLIFGAWLNYNRYGARGWDLVPHGDTIRDIPYLVKDWTRSVLNTVQGAGNRGGYSAV